MSTNTAPPDLIARWEHISSTEPLAPIPDYKALEASFDWARTSRHICGFKLTYDLPANSWTFELGADPCGDLSEPVMVSTNFRASVAVARACLMAVSMIERKQDETHHP